ncbi:unnamed protein product [Miscanthus lutarioriparius]|uniref:Glutamate carboxypeptidase 2 n=1 Tax=Miscanthus lutarioriparius TaxID=422564 RepID=A0A811SMV4_9POAL|nr:unnamed protein product [Miscanthus lutarioriparius]
MLAVLGASLAVLLFFALQPAPNPVPNYEALFLSLGSNDTAASHLRALTLHPHVAGTKANALTARYVLDALSFPAHITPYSVLLSYPVHRSLSLLAPGRGVVTSFSLKQETYPNDPYAAAAADTIPTFYAYAASGSVSAEAVYANYGREEDFAYLASRGVDVAGKVTFARYGRIHCEDIAHNARAAAGAAAAVVYTDPLEYGGAPGERWFPDSRWLPPSGVQVGSLFRGVGDPTTPMWASSEGCERVSVEEAMNTDDMPLIPALPVSAQDAMEIHRAMGGAVAPADWQGREGGPVYRLGPGPAVLNLTYLGNDTMATIENVFAIIEGAEEPDRYVILGNHRDAWTRLLKGFQCCKSKDGDLEEPLSFVVGMRKNTDWCVSISEPLLFVFKTARLITFAFTQTGFLPSTTPQLDELLQQVTKVVQDPDNSSQTVYDSWIKSSIPPRFHPQELCGFRRKPLLLPDKLYNITHYSLRISCIKVLRLGPGYPVYHSLYDDYVWMAKFGDPGFRRHVAAASIWGMMALRLANEEILPFNYMSYAIELEELQKQLLSKQLNKDSLKIRQLNDRLMQTERAFTSREGIFKQEWFKHLVYGPSDLNDWDTAIYPGIANAIASARSSNTSESWKFVQHEVYRVARAVTQASAILSGRLT